MPFEVSAACLCTGMDTAAAKLTVSMLKSHKVTEVTVKQLTVRDLYERLQQPYVDDITLEQFWQLTSPPDDMPESEAKKARAAGREEQTRRKATAGGYMLGAYRGNTRKAPAVAEYRSALAIDCDDLPEQGRKDHIAKDITDRMDRIGCSYIMHETRKSTIKFPRYRIIIPLFRNCSADMYAALVHTIGGFVLDPGWVDPTCDQPERLMFWPTVSKGQKYRFDGDLTAQKPLLDGEQLLDEVYTDWHDQAAWPELGAATDTPHAARTRGPRTRVKGQTVQADSRSKSGYIGAFCRRYPISKAISTFLSGGPADSAYTALTGRSDYPLAYAPAPQGAYTYCGPDTTTSGGAKVYDDDTFLYSYHATDPYHGILMSAWDLVRLCLFGSMDMSCDDSTPTGELPSFKAMMRFAGALEGIAVDAAASDFKALMDNPSTPVQTEPEAANIRAAGDTSADPVQPETPVVAAGDTSTDDTDTDWVTQLYSMLEWTKGDLSHGVPPRIRATVSNLVIILMYDHNLAGKICHNLFTDRIVVRGRLPRVYTDAEGKTKVRPEPRRESTVFTDTDRAEVRNYIERMHGLDSPGKLTDALQAAAGRNAFHPVRDYFSKLPAWDGVQRVETLLIDYLGAEDTPVCREVMLKHMLAAVTRIYHPGAKYDIMLVLLGRQGLGKSSFIRILAGDEWFADGIRDLNDKDALAELQGHVFVELAELDALRKSEVTQIKTFIARQNDYYRAAFGRYEKDHFRQCVFWGTTNQRLYLRDLTGNRRFACIDCATDKAMQPRKDVFRDLPGERDMIWAEVLSIYRANESLYAKGSGLIYTAETEEALAGLAETHRDADPREQLILDYCLREIPDDWGKWSEEDRQGYYAGKERYNFSAEPPKRMQRKGVCLLGIWVEALGGKRDRIPAADKAMIQGILTRTEWLEPGRYYDPVFGRVRGWAVINPPEFEQPSCTQAGGVLDWDAVINRD